jgi:hypothetical protein
VRSPSAFSMTFGLSALHDGDAGVGGAEVDTDDLAHLRPACDRDYVVLCCDMGASRVLFKALDTTAARRRKCLSAARQLPAALLTMTMAGRSRRPFRV